jgi:hypothetical protein
MKLYTPYTIAFLLLIAGTQVARSQKKDENIGTEVVNVVKPYTPTISDAFKVKETPTLDDDETQKKEEIKYHIFSFPVASTFTPSKGKAAGVDKAAKERLYKNYASIGIGNYANALAELFVTEDVGDNGYVGGMLRHFSSQGGIKGLDLDDKFMTTSLDLTYGERQNGFSWNADAGYQNQVYNWYGVYSDYFDAPGSFYNDLDPKHTYNNGYIGGKVEVSDSFFKEASIKYNRFWDSFDSSENRFYIKPSFVFDIADTKIKTDVIVDYVGGQFDKGYNTADAVKYGFTNFGLHPSFVINRDDWTIDLGAATFYSMDNEHSNNRFLVYPEVNATLKVVGDLMVFYLGAEGGLDQNSYRDFTNENPFVSPTLLIRPTDRQYDLFVGLKGKLANSVSYNVRASVKSEKDKALFKLNPLPQPADADYLGYDLGNSFGIAYDNVKTLGISGELKADFSKSVSFGVNVGFNKYTTDREEEAWNLPEITAGANLDVVITPKWYAGANVFFVGERKDFYDFTLIDGVNKTVTVDSYFDANAHVGYKYSDRLTGFLKFNNIGNKAYEKWVNYKVQQFQVMLGASYKFDF